MIFHRHKINVDFLSVNYTIAVISSSNKYYIILIHIQHILNKYSRIKTQHKLFSWATPWKMFVQFLFSNIQMLTNFEYLYYFSYMRRYNLISVSAVTSFCQLKFRFIWNKHAHVCPTTSYQMYTNEYKLYETFICLLEYNKFIYWNFPRALFVAESLLRIMFLLRIWFRLRI